MINLLGELALVYACAEDSAVIGLDTVRRVVVDRGASGLVGFVHQEFAEDGSLDERVAALLATPRDAESAQEDRPVGPTGPAAGTATVQVTPLVLTAVPYPHQAAEPVFIRKQVLPIAFQSVTVNGAFDESSSATAAALRGHAGMARANGGNWEGGTTGGSERKSGSLRRLFLPHN